MTRKQAISLIDRACVIITQRGRKDGFVVDVDHDGFLLMMDISNSGAQNFRVHFSRIHYRWIVEWHVFLEAGVEY